MNERCRAKNPSTCRTHGVGKAIDIINTHIDSGKVQKSAVFAVAAMKESAENYNPNNTANGMIVEYEDGSSEVFYGSATDPYHASDWSFTSASSHNVIKGFAYDETPGNYDNVSMGKFSIKDYQDEMDEQMVSSYPIFAEGPDEFRGQQKVAKVTVL
jgi:hypothetical protein